MPDPSQQPPPHDPYEAHLPDPADALAQLRRFSQAHCLIADRIEPIRYVIDRQHGALFFPLPDDLAGATQAQLLIPDESDPVLGALVTLSQPDSIPGALAIRYEMYHRPSGNAHFVLATIEALRYHSEVFDSDQLDLIDPVYCVEPVLCKRLNAHPERLKALCAGHHLHIESPVAVGVDPHGIDIRARFGIARIPFATPATDPTTAEHCIERLLATIDPP